jgi:putative PIN family toxin of toxin-antitoxin system
MIVVFDTDVLIPIIIGRRSRSARLLSRLESAGWRVAATPQILLEVRDKMLTKRQLRQWLKRSDEEIEKFVDRLAVLCEWVPGKRHAHGAVPADPKDDKIIAAALEAHAAYIISEDKHLLDIGSYCGVKIMNREQFAAELDRLGVPE